MKPRPVRPFAEIRKAFPLDDSALADQLLRETVRCRRLYVRWVDSDGVVFGRDLGKVRNFGDVLRKMVRLGWSLDVSMPAELTRAFWGWVGPKGPTLWLELWAKV